MSVGPWVEPFIKIENWRRQWDPELDLSNALRDIKTIAANWEGDWFVEDSNAGKIAATDVQRMYFREAQHRYQDRDDDTNWTLEEWERMLDTLEYDPYKLSGRVDWVTKLERLQAYADSSSLGWKDPDMRKVDQAYHHIDPQISLYATLKEREDIVLKVAEGHIQHAVQNPPNTTRAFGRSQVVHALASNQAENRIPWRRLHQGLGELAIWDENLLLIYQYIEGWQDLISIGAYDLVPYLVDWDAIVVNGELIKMPDPFKRYEEETAKFIEEIPRLLSNIPSDRPATNSQQMDPTANADVGLFDLDPEHRDRRSNPGVEGDD